MSTVPRRVSALIAFEPALTASLGERAHASNVGRPLGHADHAARIEQIEAMTCLDAVIVSWQREFRGHERLAFLFRVVEVPEEDGGIGTLEIESGELALRLVEHLAVPETLVECEVVNELHSLDIHRE